MSTIQKCAKREEESWEGLKKHWWHGGGGKKITKNRSDGVKKKKQKSKTGATHDALGSKTLSRTPGKAWQPGRSKKILGGEKRKVPR